MRPSQLGEEVGEMEADVKTIMSKDDVKGTCGRDGERRGTPSHIIENDE